MRKPRAKVSVLEKPSVVPATMALLAAAMLLAGCNTFSGMGQDLQSAGKTVERSAERSK